VSTAKKGSFGSLHRLAIWILVLAAWETAYRVIGWRDYVFPAPTDVVDAALDLMNIHVGFGQPFNTPGWPRLEGVKIIGRIPHNPRVVPPNWPHWLRVSYGYFLSTDLLSATFISATRLVIGFILSVILGSLLGAAMWRLTWLDDFLGPLFLGLQTLPSVCWVPLAVIVFGLQETGLMFVLVMGSFFSVAIAFRDGLRIIPPLYQRAGRMLGADGWRLYRYVLLPAALPALASSLRQGFGFAWRSLMGAEMILHADHNGLGYLLEIGRDNNSIAQIVAVMILMVIIGMTTDKLAFAKLERAVSTRFGLRSS
jgi:NitT/TauT family transport system permease protein